MGCWVIYSTLHYFKMSVKTQQLRAIVTLPEDLNLVPHTHTAAHNRVAPGPEDLTLSFDLHRKQAHT